MKTIKIIVVSLLLSVIYLGCGKEDPCANAKEVKANFRSDEKMFVGSSLYPYIIPYDYTLLMGSPAFAIDSSVEWDSLEWRIGGETIYNEPSFRRFSVPSGDLPVTLIVKKKPNTKCFPKDDGRDTITKVYK
ncbi:MAG: hypothetical protein MUE53_06790, partial [Chitinophagales bacterium]|nr:hypothetical protein [Chitinophagales bacterium]